MIKMTRIKSIKPDSPKLFIVSGGPGLSSLTMRKLDILSESFELLYVDFPGTNDNPYLGKKSFKELSQVLIDSVNAESGVKYILGHSFGGFFAASVFVQGAADGLVCLSTPFTNSALATASESYTKNMSEELSVAQDEWERKQDDASFASWLSCYGLLYFNNPQNNGLIKNDKVSSSFFKDNRSDALLQEELLTDISKKNGKKIFISGSDDKLLPPEILKSDAMAGGFDFFEVEDASHFVMLDQPEQVASLIVQNIATKN